jgi:hypothetical protein
VFAQSTSELERLQKQLSEVRAELDSLKTVERGGQSSDEPLKVALKKHFFSWATEDGKYSLTMNVRTQFRLTYNDERGQDVDSSDGAAVRALSSNGKDFWNFRVRRLKMQFTGNIFEKEFKYDVTLNFPNGGDNIVETAQFTWSRWKEFNVNVGQAKFQGQGWQELTSSGRQQFVDRGVVNGVFNQDYAKGLWFSGMISSESAVWLKYVVGVWNGRLRANNDFRNNDRSITADTFSNGAGAIDADLMPGLRLETHPLGEVAQDMTDMRDREASKKILFSVGIAFNWFISRFNNSALRTTSASPGSGRSNTGQDTVHLVVDGHFRFYGLSVNIEWHHRHTEFHNFGPLEGNSITRGRAFPGDLTDNGMAVEVGFFILPKKFDVALRWNMVDSDEFWLAGSQNKPNGIRPDMQELGLSVGYYLNGHNLKVQMDFTYVSYQLVSNVGTVPSFPNSGSSVPTRSTSSIANDNSDYVNVWQWRVQIQWIF